MSNLALKNESPIFVCSYKCKNNKNQEWLGQITMLKSYGSYVEINIISRSALWVICGKGERGFWVCIPDYNAGCELSSLNDLFFNTERLTLALKNKVDAITIAKALSLLSID